MERSTVWSAILPRLIPAHLLKVGDLPIGKHEVAKVAESGEYLNKDVGLKLPQLEGGGLLGLTVTRGGLGFVSQRRACLSCSSEDFARRRIKDPAEKSALS